MVQTLQGSPELSSELIVDEQEDLVCRLSRLEIIGAAETFIEKFSSRIPIRPITSMIAILAN